MLFRKKDKAKIGDGFYFKNPRGVYIYYQVTDIFTTKSKATKRKTLTYEMNGYLQVSQERLDSRFERER